MIAARPAREGMALLACILGSGIALLDTTAVNVALPAIERDLGGGLAAQQWIVNIYLLALGSLLLVGGSLADVYGERLVFAVGVASFGAASLLCAIAPTSGALIAARGLQGVTGALLVPSALAVIVHVFPDERRAGAVGRWAAWSGISAVIGPVVGGWLVDTASWRLVFAVNVPFVVVTVLLVLRAVPARPRHHTGRRVDVVGGLLCALGLAGPVYALIEEPSRGWSDPVVVVAFVGGLLLLGVFLWWERRSRDPMLPLALFHRRAFSVGNVYTLVTYAALGLVVFFLTLFLQGVGGYSALEAGLALAPMSCILLVLASRVGHLASAHGARPFLVVGPLLFGCGALLMMRLGPDPSYVAHVLPIAVLGGLGLSCFVAPLTTTVVVGVESAYAGIASGVNNAVARIAGMLATAVVGVLVASVYVATLDVHAPDAPPAAVAAVAEVRDAPFRMPDTAGLPPEAAEQAEHAAVLASEDAIDAVALVAAALLALGSIVAGVGLRPRRARAPERTAQPVPD